MKRNFEFPKGFLWGSATSAYQIEGSPLADGAGPSIWHRFVRTPGMVRDGDTGDVACDHYRRYKDDVKLMRDLGLKAYRFSIAWARVLPEGKGRVNPGGLDFYDRLVDGLKARGIKAFATLYHWDLPLALMGDGGWTSRATAYAFQRYAKTVIARLGDRLDAVATFNEPWCSVWLSHLYGVHAPGERNMDAALYALHFTNLAHGLGVAAVRSERPSLPVGLILRARHVERDLDDHLRMQCNLGRMHAQCLDRPLQHELAAVYGEATRCHQLGDIARCHRAVELARVAGLPDDNKCLAAELGSIVQRRCWELAKEGDPGWEMAAGEVETLINAAWRCMASVDGLIEQESRRAQEREARLERERKQRGDSPGPDASR